MADDVVCTVRSGIGELRLNRPAALNALTLDMVRELHSALGRWSRDPAVKAVLFRGTGDKAFCAGGDIRALYESYEAGDGLHERFFAEEYALDAAIHRYPKPCVALMDGLVLGGGMGIAQGTGRRIVSDRSRLGMPEVGIGFFPDVGGSFFLSRLPGRLGLYLGLTGVQIRAADALYCKLADGYVPHDRMEALLRQSHADVDLPGEIDRAMQTQLPHPPLEAVRAAIDDHFAADSVAAIVASLAREGRPAFRSWAADTIATMAGRSPTMMCVTFEQLRRGEKLSLEECLEMELRLARAAFRHGDFLEGVRALIVDKDGEPGWRPSSLDAVTVEAVSRFFD